MQNSDDINILVNGQFEQNVAIRSVTSDTNDDVWAEDEVLEIEVDLGQTLNDSGNRLTVSTKGTERSIEFSV